eukprot:359131-Chlamydomonas_euryale.AAC.6
MPTPMPTPLPNLAPQNRMQCTRQYYAEGGAGGDGARFVSLAAALYDEADGMLRCAAPPASRSPCQQAPATPASGQDCKWASHYTSKPPPRIQATSAAPATPAIHHTSKWASYHTSRPLPHIPVFDSFVDTHTRCRRRHCPPQGAAPAAAEGAPGIDACTRRGRAATSGHGDGGELGKGGGSRGVALVRGRDVRGVERASGWDGETRIKGPPLREGPVEVGSSLGAHGAAGMGRDGMEYGMEWNGMEWNGMEWNGMEWNGMEWNGMEWNGMEWNGNSSVEAIHHRAGRCTTLRTPRCAHIHGVGCVEYGTWHASSHPPHAVALHSIYTPAARARRRGEHALDALVHTSVDPHIRRSTRLPVHTSAAHARRRGEHAPGAPAATGTARHGSATAAQQPGAAAAAGGRASARLRGSGLGATMVGVRPTPGPFSPWSLRAHLCHTCDGEKDVAGRAGRGVDVLVAC